MKKSVLKDALEKLYKRYNRGELIKPDPLQFVYRYDSPSDMEIAGFLAAALAYGRVQQIEKSVDELLRRMDESPSEFVVNFNIEKQRRLSGFKHRFNTGDDIAHLIELLQWVLGEFGGIEAFFLQGYDQSQLNIIPALSIFCDALAGRYEKKYRRAMPSHLKYLLANPANGSTCKRLNLFLRWMVRDKDIDTGLWKRLDKARLIVPVDVHMARLCRILGLYKRKSVSLAAAIEITNSFAELQPQDPVKYDFALSRVGIVEGCDGRHRPECEICELFGVCSVANNKADY